MKGFWLYMLIISLIIPAAMICLGFCLSRKAPKKINSIYGYRTKRAKKNQDTWEFANKHCGKTWYMLGIALIVLTVGIMKGCSHESQEVVAVMGGTTVIIQVLALVISIIPTELALRKNFDADGRRKTTI